MRTNVKKPGILLIVFLVICLAVCSPGWSGIIKASNGSNSPSVSADPDLAGRLSDAIVLYTGSPTALVNNVEKQVDSGNGEVVPVVISGRIFVPIRFIAENLGAGVDWNGQASTAEITLEGRVIRITLGENVMSVNGIPSILDTPALSINSRTCVPLRAVSEAFGKKLFYDRGLVVISDRENLFDKDAETALLDSLIARVNNLPAVNSAENLLALVEKYQSSGGGYSLEKRMANVVTADGVQQAEAAAPAGGSDEAAADYSSTNVQVAGVDEADLVKTDGEYIYQVTSTGVVVSKAYPAKEMSVAARLAFDDPQFRPSELYLDSDYLVVIGHSTDRAIAPYDDGPQAKRILPPYYYQNRVKTYIYDIRDQAKIAKAREVEIDGRYVSSRKIGSYVYLVARHNINTYWIQEKGNDLAPTYRDSAVKNEFIPVPYQEIRYIPPIAYPSYLVIAGFDLARPAEPAQISTYLGSGEDIYVSGKNLYIALTQYTDSVNIYQPTDLSAEILRPGQRATMVYKFSLNQGRVTYLNKGLVPGNILNQFSMDEYQNHFRIATTSRKALSRGGSTSSNNIYVLDENMSLVGYLEDIAPGEQIFSTRFMGERAYMVTFKNVDPLFVLDLKNPANPSILGALKIPGYSDYLHPYDANHIIGFGKDTVEIAQKDYTGKVIGTQSYYLGVKMALFDVSDVANPQEKFNEKIGDRGTDSELLHDHKALLFRKETGLLAFPVTLMELQGKPAINPRGYPEHGSFTFQGAYVYHLDPATGFTLKGRVTHQTTEDLTKAGYYSANPQREVKRALYIGDVLYTTSEEMLKANSLSDLAELNSLSLNE